MDDDSHGVKATVIDLGLARMDSGDYEDEERVRWTPFEEEIFQGEGDYQFEVYRMMRVHNGDSWTSFKPLTNVMWLHYLTLKLLNSKRLKPPASRKSVVPSSATSFTERDCYQCLVEMENTLGEAVAHCKSPLVEAKKKGRRKTQAVGGKIPALIASLEGTGGAGGGLKSAIDVLELAKGRGWVG